MNLQGAAPLNTFHVGTSTIAGGRAATLSNKSSQYLIRMNYSSLILKKCFYAFGFL